MSTAPIEPPARADRRGQPPERARTASSSTRRVRENCALGVAIGGGGSYVGRGCLIRWPVAADAPRELFLIDGNSLAYRAFFALPETIATSRGMPTNAIFGFASMLVKILTEHGQRPRSWSGTPATSGREEIYADYKAGALAARPAVRAVAAHAPLVEAFGYRNVKVEGYEADDVIATLAGGRGRGPRRDDRHRRPRHLPAGRARRPRDGHEPRHHRDQDLRPRGGDRPLRHPAGADPRLLRPQGRHLRQHPGRAGHRRQDRLPAPPALRRPGGRARERGRDLRRQAQGEPDQPRRGRPRVEAARHRHPRRRSTSTSTTARARARPLAPARVVPRVRAARPAAAPRGGAGRGDEAAPRDAPAATLEARAVEVAAAELAGLEGEPRGAAPAAAPEAAERPSSRARRSWRPLRFAAYAGGDEVLVGEAETLAAVLRSRGGAPGRGARLEGDRRREEPVRSRRRSSTTRWSRPTCSTRPGAPTRSTSWPTEGSAPRSRAATAGRAAVLTRALAERQRASSRSGPRAAVRRGRAAARRGARGHGARGRQARRRALGEIAARVGGEIAELEREIRSSRARSSRSARRSSSAEVLFEQLGLSRKRRGKTGFSTDARVLQAIRGGAPDHRQGRGAGAS